MKEERERRKLHERVGTRNIAGKNQHRTTQSTKETRHNPLGEHDTKIIPDANKAEEMSRDKNRKDTSKSRHLETEKNRGRSKPDSSQKETTSRREPEIRASWKTDNHKATPTKQVRTGEERTEAGAKNTTTSTRRSRHQGRERSPRDKEEKQSRL